MTRPKLYNTKTIRKHSKSIYAPSYYIIRAYRVMQLYRNIWGTQDLADAIGGNSSYFRSAMLCLKTLGLIEKGKKNGCYYYKLKNDDSIIQFEK